MVNKSNREQFLSCIQDLIDSPIVQSMQRITQHVDVNCLDHSLYVSYISFLWCRALGLNYRQAARGALLHDLFLYNQKDRRNFEGRHLLTHPYAALKNAQTHFDLTELEKDIIVKHMWPITAKIPKYKESLLVGLADKFCALSEMLFIYKAMRLKRRLSFPSLLPA